MYKKIAILGADSFIGFHIARRMANLGFWVSTFVDASTDVWRLREKENVFEIIRVKDLANSKFVISALKTINPKYLFFISNFFENPLSYSLEQELSFFKELLKEQDELFFETLIFVGFCPTCKENNFCVENQILPKEYKINLLPCIPSMLVQANKNNQKSFFVVQPATVYGEYFSEHSALGQFIIDAILEKKFNLDLSIFEKDFISSHDFSNFLVNLMIAKPIQKAFFYCNNGSAINLSLFLQLFRSNFSGIDLSGFNCSVLDKIDKITTLPRDSTEGLFSWNRTISIEHGLIKTIRWGQNNINLYRRQNYSKCTQQKINTTCL